MIANGLLAIVQRRVLMDGILRLRSRKLGYLSISYPLASLCNVFLRSGLDEAVLRNHGGAY